MVHSMCIIILYSKYNIIASHFIVCYNVFMSNPNVSEVIKNYNKTLTQEYRTTRARNAALAKNSRMTPEERRAHSLMMVEKRNENSKHTTS